MFKVEYGILDEEKKRIAEVRNISEFEKDLNTVVGQIEIIFNDRQLGFVEMDVPYDGEYLITWFKWFNEVIFYLKNFGFATMYESDTDNFWLEFLLKDNIIEVREIKADDNNIKGYVHNTPLKAIEVEWNESIRRDEFYSAILDKTENLINTILSLNKLMAESQEVIDLQKKYFRSKNVQ